MCVGTVYNSAVWNVYIFNKLPLFLFFFFVVVSIPLHNISLKYACLERATRHSILLAYKSLNLIAFINNVNVVKYRHIFLNRRNKKYVYIMEANPFFLLQHFVITNFSGAVVVVPIPICFQYQRSYFAYIANNTK